MGSVGPVAMAGAGYSPGSLRAEGKRQIRFILIFSEAGAGAGSLCVVKIFGKVVLNLLRTYVHAADGVSSINTLYGMNVTVSLTSLLVMHPQRKVRSAWVAGLSW